MGIHPCSLTLALLLAGCAAIADPCDTRIPPPDVVPANDFGGPIAAIGDHWFIADINASLLCPGVFGCTAGVVHVYEMVDGSLEHRQMLTAPIPVLGDAFGGAMDTHGGRLLVGATRGPGTGVASNGGGFVYEFDGDRWVLTGTMLAPEGVDPSRVEYFGGIAAMEDRWAYLRPAYREFIFAYELRGDSWEYLEMIESPDGLPREAGFGFSMEAVDDWVFLGAYRDSSLVRWGGSVYAYRRRPDGTLALAQKITPADVPAGPELTRHFGWQVSCDGRTLAIGANAADRPESASGVVLLYELVNDAWVLKQELTHPDAAEVDQLGYTVSVRGALLTTTAYGQATPATSSTIHVYRRNASGQWRHDGKLLPEVPVYAGHYVGGVIHGDWIMASSPSDVDAFGDASRAAYLFDLSCFDCPPDLDADGSLTVFDFLTFLNLFQDANPIADFDGDGELTIFDFLAFQDAFQAGCG